MREAGAGQDGCVRKVPQLVGPSCDLLFVLFADSWFFYSLDMLDSSKSFYLCCYLMLVILGDYVILYCNSAVLS